MSSIYQGIARTQSPTNKNYALELPTFGAIVGVSPTEVQWKGLALKEPPSWSRLTFVPGKYEDCWECQQSLSWSKHAWFDIWSRFQSVKKNFALNVWLDTISSNNMLWILFLTSRRFSSGIKPSTLTPSCDNIVCSFPAKNPHTSVWIADYRFYLYTYVDT